MEKEELYSILDISKSNAQKLHYYSSNFKTTPSFPVIIWGIYNIKFDSNLNDKMSQTILEDLKKSQSFFLEQAKIVLDENPPSGYEDLAQLTPIERYIEHVCKRFDPEVKTRLDEITIRKSFMLDEETAEIYERYYPESLFEACYLFFMMITVNNNTLYKCGHCEKYFVKRPGNNQYCNRRILGTNKTCKDVGAKAKYKKDNIQLTFEKYYKKVTKYCERKGLKDSYANWYTQVFDLKEKARSENMSIEDFIDQLEEIEQREVYIGKPKQKTRISSMSTKRT
jgi:hypothetical protein